MTRQRILAALIVLELVIVTGAAIRYGTDGPAATVISILLAPVAVWSTASAGARIGGPRLGLVAAGIYILLPWLASMYMLVTYRSTFEHRAIPNLLGLRETAWFALGVGITLTLAYAPRLVLGVAGLVATSAAIVAWGTEPLGHIRGDLHETVWSITLLEWLVVAGLIGTARRSVWLAIALGGWLVAAVLHGADGGYESAAFWRSLSVAAPAASLVLSSLCLLVPPLRRPRMASSSEHAR
jgi:hypothetical protein